MTAKEFLVRDELFSKPLTAKEKDFYIKTILSHNGYIEAMIAFAKLHVEKALKQASEEVYVSDHTNCEIDRDSILNCYPLENIK